MPSFSSLAVAQTSPLPGEIAANTAEHLRLAQLASSGGARILVYPELSLTGYEIRTAPSVAFTERDPRLLPLSDAASTYGMTIVVGAPVRLDGGLHIGAFILSPDRSVQLYTKHRLGAFSATASCDGAIPSPEATVFLAGDRNPLIRIGDTVAAVAICSDIGLPSHPQKAAERGANSYLASMFVIRSEFDADAAKLRGYARKHAMVVALANFGSPTGGLVAAGRSSIWSASGELLIELESQGSGVAIAVNEDGGWRTAANMIGDGGVVANSRSVPGSGFCERRTGDRMQRNPGRG